MDDKPKTTPKDFFLYCGAIITLYWSAGSLIALLFAVADAMVKDELNFYSDPYSGGIRFAIASLIVVFPVSLMLFRTIKKDALREAIKFSLPLRRWLYALTIFITAVALIGDVIALLNSFLGGELTSRFLLKALSVLLVAGLVFWYCFLEIRVRPEAPKPVRKEFLYGTPLFVLLSIVFGFYVMGSPSAMRSIRLDDGRVGDLQNIQWQIVNFWQQKGKLPQSLSELEDPISGFKVPRDPKTKSPYEYAVDSDSSFELCAVFESDTSARRGNQSAYLKYSTMDNTQNWEHGANRACFKRSIDRDLYPVRTPAKPV